MMNPAEKRRRMEQAMYPLCGDVRFQGFMELVREQMDVAVEDAVSDRVIANDRLLNAALGEIRCYKSLIAVFESFKAQADSDNERLAPTD